MTKTYKVRMYEVKGFNMISGESVNQLFTAQRLIDFVYRVCNESVKTAKEACSIINENKGCAYEVIVELTDDDFVDNIKPDGTIAYTLNLGHFEDNVPKADYLIENFHKLLTEQQKVICTFIDKAELLLTAISNQFGDDEYQLIQSKAIGVLKAFVHDRFVDFDRPDTDSQIMNMRGFNELDDDILLELLTAVVDEMTISDLMSDDSLVLSSYSDDFWHELNVTRL